MVYIRYMLCAWNATLCLFSAAAFVRSAEEMLHVVRTYGFRPSVCFTPQPFGVMPFWISAFAWSKVVELGDTLFLVGMQRPVVTLHWYHHVTVLLYTWHSST